MYKDNGFFEESYKEFFKTANVEDSIKQLSKQIYEMTTYLEFLHDLIPLKYKRTFPSPGENPFFAINTFKIPDDPKEYQEAKRKMENFHFRVEDERK